MMASVGENDDNQVRLLAKWMQETHYTFTDEWLVACLENIDKNYPNGASVDEIRKELTTMWRNADLRKMKCSCLPDNLISQRTYTLTGKYGLQIQSIRDVNEPSYNQFMRINNLENENCSVAATDSNEYKSFHEPVYKRTLYITMTDGTQTIFAVEINPVQTLSVLTKPGTKVFITGPIECRRGVLQLKPANIEIDGGEITELCNTNSYTKIIDDIITTIRSDIISDGSSHKNETSGKPVASNICQPSMVVSGEFPDSPCDPFNSTFDEILMELDEQAIIKSACSTNAATLSTALDITDQTHISPTKHQPAYKTMSNNNSVKGRSFYFKRRVETVQPPSLVSGSNIGKTNNNMDIRQFMKPLPLVIDPPTPETNIKRQRQSINEKDGLFGEKLRLRAVEFKNMKTKSPITDNNSTKGVGMGIEFLCDKNQGETPLSFSSLVRNTETNISTKKKYPIIVPDCPFVFIQQIQEKVDALSAQRKVVKVKACISTVVSNISIENGSWKLRASINDGTGSLDCCFSSELLHSIIGLTPDEMRAAKKTSVGQNSITRKLKLLQQKLVNLNSLLEIEINESYTILRIIDPTFDHLAAINGILEQLQIST